MSSFDHKILQNLSEMIETIRPTSADSQLVFKPAFIINLGLLVSFKLRL